jgi:heme/copper-type cytochrome/quinol oxidase subunit 2
MDKKNVKNVWIAVGAVIVLVVVILIFTKAAPQGFLFPSPGNAPSVPGATQASSTKPSVVTRSAVPTNVTVPNKGDANVPSNVAVPQVEGPASPLGNAHYRSFNITVANGQFSPDTVAVNLGDTVNLEVAASGQSYDFTQPDYGMKVQIPAGVTKQVQFSATATGKFLFYCSSCGGPASGPTGYLIVTK